MAVASNFSNWTTDVAVFFKREWNHTDKHVSRFRHILLVLLFLEGLQATAVDI